VRDAPLPLSVATMYVESRGLDFQLHRERLIAGIALEKSITFGVD
jgi:hypothetical protein